MKNAVVVGAGPAGISAALYLVRAGIETTVVAKGAGALEKAEKIENYYGFPEPIEGKKLVENGIAQAKRLGARFVAGEVVGLGYDEKLTVKATLGEYPADCVVLATGTSRKLPKIPGLQEYEGRGVSFCAVCDAFFYRKKAVAVLGGGEFALAEAMELLPVVDSVTLLTDGATPIAGIPPEIVVITKPVRELAGGERLEKVIFKDGSELMVAGVFLAVGVAGSADLARKIGIITEGNTIAVDSHMATNVPGIYAAGDCTGGMLQIAKAVYQGALAGTEATKYLRNI